jgi:hypothetical protein
MSLPSPGSNGIREWIQRAGKAKAMPEWLGWLICIPFGLAVLYMLGWVANGIVEHFTR